MNGKSKSLSQRQGHVISNLIGIATELKHSTRGMATTPTKSPSKFTYEERYNMALKQREEAVHRAAAAERQVIEVKRAKLANFSIDDIADELQRRLDTQRK